MRLLDEVRDLVDEARLAVDVDRAADALRERQGTVDDAPGFEGFQLLRPTAGEDRYFVVTTWASEEDFQRWRDGRMPAAHAAEQGGRPAPVATGADLLEFEVVDLG